MTDEKIVTIYWGVLLDEVESNKLKAAFEPVHPNVYAEHTTIVFRPNEEQEAKWMERIGDRVSLTVTSHAKDEKGQAVGVMGIEREDMGIPHITISCANGIKPFYSNELLKKNSEAVWPFDVAGVIARFTNVGWDKGK